MINIRDKTYVVTGGTSSLGRALALNLTSMGADVAILDKNPEKARRIVDEITESREIKESHGSSAYFECEISDANSVKEAVSKAAETFGGIDVLVSALQAEKISPVTNPEFLSDLDHLLNINAKGAAFATHAVLPFMRGRKKGKIIFLISDLVRWGAEGESLSALSRGGLVYFARSLARELASSNIQVNCVATGPTEEYLLARDPKAISLKATEEKLLKGLPMGRTLRADEIAQTVTFLSSSQADAVTGQTWAVNGGLTMA
jgi:NAD(P)-dependent dehydrogenase (short-subunit alcohol dehydrogenase family)